MIRIPLICLLLLTVATCTPDIVKDDSPVVVGALYNLEGRQAAHQRQLDLLRLGVQRGPLLAPMLPLEPSAF